MPGFFTFLHVEMYFELFFNSFSGWYKHNMRYHKNLPCDILLECSPALLLPGFSLTQAPFWSWRIKDGQIRTKSSWVMPWVSLTPWMFIKSCSSKHCNECKCTTLDDDYLHMFICTAYQLKIQLNFPPVIDMHDNWRIKKPLSWFFAWKF